MTKINQFIEDLTPYQIGLPIEQVAREYGVDTGKIIKLASNENPLGASPKALEAYRAAATEAHRYPEHYELAVALAKHYDIDTRWLVIGNGTNDVIDLIARTYLDAGDESVVSEYAFAMYHVAIQSVGAQTVVAPAKDYGHDLPAMLRAITPATKVVWLANPNNPTGTFIPYAEVKRFLEQVPAEVMVVLDEAYCEYLEPDERTDTYAWILEHPNLIVLRTFSKIYGLAGMRIGYGVADKTVAGYLNRVRLPFNVNGPALAAAAAALVDDEFTHRSYELNLEGRQLIAEGLSDMGLEYLPAYGNFVTFRIENADHVHKQLLKQGIIIRPLKAYGMPDWLRVSIGLPAENQQFLAALGVIRDTR